MHILLFSSSQIRDNQRKWSKNFLSRTSRGCPALRLMNRPISWAGLSVGGGAMAPHPKQSGARALAELLVAERAWRPANTTKAWQLEPALDRTGSTQDPEKKKTAFGTPLLVELSHSRHDLCIILLFRCFVNPVRERCASGATSVACSDFSLTGSLQPPGCPLIPDY